MLSTTRGPRRLEDLLDVVDRRTLNGLVRVAGLGAQDFPQTAFDFLVRQRIVTDARLVSEISQIALDPKLLSRIE